MTVIMTTLSSSQALQQKRSFPTKTYESGSFGKTFIGTWQAISSVTRRYLDAGANLSEPMMTRVTNVALIENTAKLSEIASFSHDWNGYGADPIKEVVVKRMRDLLPLLSRQPDIFPLPDGDMQFEYDNEATGCYLEFVLTESVIRVLYLNEHDEDMSWVMSPDDIGRLNALIDDFYGPGI